MIFIGKVSMCDEMCKDMRRSNYRRSVLGESPKGFQAKGLSGQKEGIGTAALPAG